MIDAPLIFTSQSARASNDRPIRKLITKELTAKKDSIYIFGGNPGGADHDRFDDFWRLEMKNEEDLEIRIKRILEHCCFYTKLAQDPTQACLFLRGSSLGVDIFDLLENI